jgi:hypothetical protein
MALSPETESALKLVLLFYSGVWDRKQQIAWDNYIRVIEEATGRRIEHEPTSRILCDAVRAVLYAGSEYAASTLAYPPEDDGGRGGG